MRLKATLLFSLFLFCSCKEETKIQNAVKEEEPTETIETTVIPSEEGFRFEDFQIRKGGLGRINVGMSLEESEKYLRGLTRKRCDPFDFGFDGGGDAYIYYWKDQPVLALIPEMDTNILLAIAAIHKELKTDSGLHPNATIKEIQRHYGNLPLYQNLMMSWEFMYDEKANWDFVFMKDTEHQVGNYETPDAPGKVIDFNAKTDWITIH